MLLLTAFLLFAGGLFSSKAPIDIHLSDTYYVFPLAFLIWFPAIILFLFWLLYLATKRFLYSKRLMWIHIILSVVISLFILTLPYLSTYSYGEVAGSPRRYYDYGELNNFKIFGNFTNMIVLAFLILVLGQLIYFINLIVGIYKRVDRLNNR